LAACCCPAAYRKACLEHHPDKKLVGVDCEDAKVRSSSSSVHYLHAGVTLLAGFA
jgi:hypothetical protein